MRGSHDVALEFPFQHIGVSLLTASCHGLTNERECLMPIESTQLDLLTIEFKAVIGEAGIAKAETALVFVDDRVALLKANHHGVQVRAFQVPFLNRAKPAESDLVRYWIDRRGARRNRLMSSGNRAVLVTELRFQRERVRLRLESADETGNRNTRLLRKSIPGLHKDIFDIRGRHKAQMHVAINAAKGQIIDLASKRRNIGTLG